MSHYILTRPADDDLLDIFHYTLEKWDEAQLEKYAAQLESAFLQLAEDPFKIGSKSAGHLAHGCRLFRVGHHIIAYRPEENYLLIVRILHESMDLPQHISDQAFD